MTINGKTYQRRFLLDKMKEDKKVFFAFLTKTIEKGIFKNEEEATEFLTFAKNSNEKFENNEDLMFGYLNGNEEAIQKVNEIYKESMEEAKILYQQYLEYMEKVKKALDYNKVMNTYMFINMDYEQKSKKVEEERRLSL